MKKLRKISNYIISIITVILSYGKIIFIKIFIKVIHFCNSENLQFKLRIQLFKFIKE